MSAVSDPRMVAECRNCGKTVNLRWPRGMSDDGFVCYGDGTAYITHWHKDPETGEDCRSEIDASDAREFVPTCRTPQPVTPASVDRLTTAQVRVLDAVRSGAVVATGTDGDAKVQYGLPGEDRWTVLPERSMRALIEGELVRLEPREYGEAFEGHPRLWSQKVAPTDSGLRALESTQTPPSEGDRVT
jgi:hypothetical protein